MTENSYDMMNNDLRLFIADKAHAFNNLLSTINGAVIILDKYSTSPVEKQSLTRIKSAVSKATEHSRDLGSLFDPKIRRRITFWEDKATRAGFKAHGLVILAVGSLTEADQRALEEAGINVLEAKNLEHALLVQDDIDGPIDFIVLTEGYENKEQENLRNLTLFRSLREETKTIVKHDKEPLWMQIYHAKEDF